MSFFTRRKQEAVTRVMKAEALKKPIVLKAECMQQSQAANEASNSAYQTNAPQEQPSTDDQVKAHMAAAKAHDVADKAHRAAGKEYAQSAPTVAQAHFQQSNQHFQRSNDHEAQARDMQDSQSMGYR